jgi:hypothetical protein
MGTVPAQAQSDESSERAGGEQPDVFMWGSGGRIWVGGGRVFEREPEMTENLFAFARRHRIIPYAHTIKLGYTPSRREPDADVRVTLRGGADGFGWHWPDYAATGAVRTSPDTIGSPAGYDVSYDPFVPNA